MIYNRVLSYLPCTANPERCPYSHCQSLHQLFNPEIISHTCIYAHMKDTNGTRFIRNIPKTEKQSCHICILIVTYFTQGDTSCLEISSPLLMLNVILPVSVSQKDLCNTLVSLRLKCQPSVSGSLFQSNTNVRQRVLTSVHAFGSEQPSLDQPKPVCFPLTPFSCATNISQKSLLFVEHHSKPQSRFYRRRSSFFSLFIFLFSFLLISTCLYALSPQLSLQSPS